MNADPGFVVFYVDPKSGTDVICPSCGLKRHLGAGVCLEYGRELNILCRCGESFQCRFEYRKYYRWTVKFKALYVNATRGGRGVVAVENISEGGMGFRVEGKHSIQAGDILEVNFRMDLETSGEVTKRVNVVHLKNGYVGACFNVPPALQPDAHLQDDDLPLVEEVLVEDARNKEEEALFRMTAAREAMEKALQRLELREKDVADVEDVEPLLDVETDKGEQGLQSVKLYAADAPVVVIDCPACGTTRNLGVDRLRDKMRMGGNSFIVDCSCGERFRCELEYRRFYRKPVSLLGECKDLETGSTKDVLVEDLSLGGALLQVQEAHRWTKGDVLEVRFQLDTPSRPSVTRRIRVMSVRGKQIGTQFVDGKRDTDLGFYLLA